MHEDPILTREKIGEKMEELHEKFKKFYNTPNPNKEDEDKPNYGGYDDWLNEMKKKNYTQY